MCVGGESSPLVIALVGSPSLSLKRSKSQLSWAECNLCNQRLRAPRDQILDQEIDARMANVPFLTPTPCTPPQATPAPTYQPSLNAAEDLIDYLNNVREIPRSVSPRVKKLQEEIKSICNQVKLFEVRESNSALRNFARVYILMV